MSQPPPCRQNVTYRTEEGLDEQFFHSHSERDRIRCKRDLPPLTSEACGRSADRKYMNEVLDDGFSNTKDPANMVARLETAFAEKFGVGYGIAQNSGSGTMLSALLAAGVGPGDEVLVPT